MLSLSSKIQGSSLYIWASQRFINILIFRVVPHLKWSISLGRRLEIKKPNLWNTWTDRNRIQSKKVTKIMRNRSTYRHTCGVLPRNTSQLVISSESFHDTPRVTKSRVAWFIIRWCLDVNFCAMTSLPSANPRTLKRFMGSTNLCSARVET